MRLLVFFTLMFCFIAGSSIAQGFNPYRAYGEPTPQKTTFRTIMNKITLTAATGAGYSFYNHALENYTILNYNDRLYINPNGTSEYYNRWLNKPLLTGSPGSTDAMINTDTVMMGFRGTGFSLPLLFSLHYQHEWFRIGAGASFEFHQFRKMEPTSYLATLGSYEESFSSLFSRYFGNVGVEFYRWYEYHYYFDVYAGIMKYGSGFDRSLLNGSMFINLGIPIEREFSEYFKVYVRPSWEFKNFSMGLPGSDRTIKNSFQGFFVNIGFRYNMPDLRRCPIKSCETQKIHTHQGMGDLRGRPFYKKQRPQIGENYKHSPLFRRGGDRDAPKSKIRRRDPRK
jgi:hypothetical protein